MMLDSPERRWRGLPRAWPVLQGMPPIERSRVPAEALAGLTLAALGIPAVLGYAKIAGMPTAARVRPASASAGTRDRSMGGIPCSTGHACGSPRQRRSGESSTISHLCPVTRVVWGLFIISPPDVHS